MNDYEKWNHLKQSLNSDNNREVFFKERELWWCSTGYNIGSEQNGKNKDFERPVLIIRKLSKEKFIGVPQTTKESGNPAHRYQYQTKDGLRYLLGDQIRTFSSKRLLRKQAKLSKENFLGVKMKVLLMLVDH